MTQLFQSTKHKREMKIKILIDVIEIKKKNRTRYLTYSSLKIKALYHICLNVPVLSCQSINPNTQFNLSFFQFSQTSLELFILSSIHPKTRYSIQACLEVTGMKNETERHNKETDLINVKGLD